MSEKHVTGHALFIESGHTARLFTVDYKDVVRLPIPPGPLPERIYYQGRTFRYYAHTVAEGHEETEHPYREEIPSRGYEGS